MTEGWWVNFKTKRYVELLCPSVDHERALRDPENQAWLGIPPAVVKQINCYRPQIDRDGLLQYVMRRCPVARIRGHRGNYTTVQFSSFNSRRVMQAARKWAALFAAPDLLLNLSNLATGKSMQMTVREMKSHRGTTVSSDVLQVFRKTVQKASVHSAMKSRVFRAATDG